MKFVRIIFLIFLLSSCSDPAKEIIGRWKPVGIVSLGEELDLSNDRTYMLEFKPVRRLIPRPHARQTESLLNFAVLDVCGEK